MNAMKYENFIRKAFSINFNTMIGRSGDLGGLAEADIFRIAESGDPHCLNETKIGTGYAIAIYNNEIFNNSSVSDSDYSTMNSLFDQVLSASSAIDIISIIDNYNVYIDRYFTFRWNR